MRRMLQLRFSDLKRKVLDILDIQTNEFDKGSEELEYSKASLDLTNDKIDFLTKRASSLNLIIEQKSAEIAFLKSENYSLKSEIKDLRSGNTDHRQSSNLSLQDRNDGASETGAVGRRTDNNNSSDGSINAGDSGS